MIRTNKSLAANLLVSFVLVFGCSKQVELPSKPAAVKVENFTWKTEVCTDDYPAASLEHKIDSSGQKIETNIEYRDGSIGHKTYDARGELDLLKITSRYGNLSVDIVQGNSPGQYKIVSQPREPFVGTVIFHVDKNIGSVIGLDVYSPDDKYLLARCKYKTNPHSDYLTPLADWTFYWEGTEKPKVELQAWQFHFYTQLNLFSEDGKLVYQEQGEPITTQYNGALSVYDTYVYIIRRYANTVFATNGLASHRIKTSQRFFCQWLCEIDEFTELNNDGSIKSTRLFQNRDPGTARYKWQDEVEEPIKGYILTVARCYAPLNECTYIENMVIKFVREHCPELKLKEVENK